MNVSTPFGYVMLSMWISMCGFLTRIGMCFIDCSSFLAYNSLSDSICTVGSLVCNILYYGVSISTPFSCGATMDATFIKQELID